MNDTTMSTAIKGIFENGHITLLEKSPVNKRMEVIVTFMDERTASPKKRVAGVLSGKVKMSDDFDDPLTELNDDI